MILIHATNNQGKLEELQQAAGDFGNAVASWTQYTKEKLPPPAESGLSYTENARQKALYYAQKINRPVIGDDGGLELTAFPDLFGINTQRSFPKGLTAAEQNQYLLNLLKDCTGPKRGACLKAVLVYATPDGREITAKGALTGEISTEPRGTDGYGFDTIFYLPTYHKTLAELPKEIRNRLSPRLSAFEKICKELNKHDCKTL